MDFQEQRLGAVMVLKPQGPVTGADADLLRSRLQAVLARSLGRCVLDASAVAFVDSRGLEALLEVSEELSQSGRALKVCAANETLREVLDLVGIAPAFEMFEDVNTGVRSFL